MLSSNNKLDTHYRWYVVMCVIISSLCLPSNLGISAGILAETNGQEGWCCMGYFVILDGLGRLSVAKKETMCLQIDSSLKVRVSLYQKDHMASPYMY